jgi:hypothetical protein
MNMQWRIGLAAFCIAAIRPPAAALESTTVREIPRVAFDAGFERTGVLCPPIEPQIAQKMRELEKLPGFPRTMQKIADDDRATYDRPFGGALLYPLLHARGNDTGPVNARQISDARKILLEWAVMTSNLAPQAAALAERGPLGPNRLKGFKAIADALKQLQWALDRFFMNGEQGMNAVEFVYVKNAVNLAEDNRLRWEHGQSHNGLTLAINAERGVRVWELPSKGSLESRVRANLVVPKDITILQKTQLSLDGQILAAGAKDKVIVWNTLMNKMPAVVAMLGTERPLMAVNGDPPHLLAVASFAGHNIWRFKINGEQIQPYGETIRLHNKIFGLHFNHENGIHPQFIMDRRP